ncbi:hypothetical protein FP2506_08991 [Fulvimarina pelagi HTCC2506]|uniref:Uncharacterized protein n=1 Tax=Fulvimarina pelagi HTCC2506 TaxID=314231 RepID=Q0G5U8_9HYPH|nr:hypothetical protein [Fulvimarina pelagi]EAU42966.1 hypothetical protein FP2506_08991 [Fulvimarina pelagi HTCC2506]
MRHGTDEDGAGKDAMLMNYRFAENAILAAALISWAAVVSVALISG